MPIPPDPGGLTASYLTTVLRDAGVLRSSVVTSAQVSVVPAGTGFAGQAAHVTLTYDRPEPDAPTRMFAKLSTADPQVLARLRPVGLFETEAGFYRELSGDCPQRVPRAFASLYEPDSGMTLLLLEDLSTLRFGNNVEGASPDDARAALVALARMQAHYWNSPRLPQCGWLRSAVHDRVSTPPLMRSLVPVFETRWSATAPASVVAAVRALAAHAETWIDGHLAGPRTLSHGDYRPDNMAFTSDGDTVLFDWQTARFDAGSRDVAYFLTYALTVDARREHEAALLELYHETLVRSGVRDYTRADVQANHRRSVGTAVSRLLIAGATLDFSSERGTLLARALMARVAAAVDDHDFLGWIETM